MEAGGDGKLGPGPVGYAGGHEAGGMGPTRQADRQLHIFNTNRDIVEVVRAIADATEVAPEPEPAAAA